MKQILRITLAYYIFLAAITGSIYKIIENTNNESILKLIGLNIINIFIAFVISYFGHKSQQKKNNND
jgi:hypothetical protein